MFLAFLIACSLDHPSEALPVEASSPPPPLHMEVGDVVAGAPVVVTVTGATFGDVVFLIRGRSLGENCTAYSQTCFSIEGPLHRVGVAAADRQGEATFRFRPPAGAAGAYLTLQALVSPGAASPVSQPVGRLVGAVGTVVSPNADSDLDGFTPADGDCADWDPSFFPGAPDPAADGIDYDCDDHDGTDADADGVWDDQGYLGGDCDDSAVDVFPGAFEACDAIDNDCDGIVDDDACGLSRTFPTASHAADLLFVIDNSGSMAEEQALFASATSSLLGRIDPVALDLHLGVITTDMDNPVESGRLRPVGADPFANPGDDFQAFFDAAIVQGTAGSGTERGLAATQAALSLPLVAGDNAGFSRPSSDLYVFFLTDEEDYSTIGTARWVTAIQGTRAPGYGVEAHGIVGPVGGCALAENGARYRDVISGTGGTESSPCEPDYAPALQGLGDAINARSSGRVWPIGAADPATILATWVDAQGVVQTISPADLSYDAATGSLTWTGAPLPGDPDVTVRWDR